MNRIFHRAVLAIAATAALTVAATQARAFCGFYVAQADTKLFNQSSKVVLARDGDKTVITMANDYQGDPKEFAIVIPVPVVVTKEQVKVADSALIDHLDQYTAPRLVEYWDSNPCETRYEDDVYYEKSAAMPSAAEGAAPARRGDLGVRIEASYSVGEYDILILSAEQATGLETWLKQNGYRIPDGASTVLGSYIRQNMKFFVAKVNLQRHIASEQSYLNPIQVSYESPKFMLPIRLGMVNANGAQELFIFALTAKGRVEATNYRTTKIPTDVDVSEFVQKDFGPFYKSMFDREVAHNGMSTVFLEYAWPLQVSCDPCTAEMLSGTELQSLGATWAQDYHYGVEGGFITRLHVRYDQAHFPEDLVFQETPDNATFQGRYAIHHPATGDLSCKEGKAYQAELTARRQKEAGNVAELTGWTFTDVWKRVQGG